MNKNTGMKMLNVIVLLVLSLQVTYCIIDLPQREKTKLAIIGDSNSLRLTVGFEDNLACHTTNNEQQVDGHVPNAGYWDRGGKITGLVIHSRDCGGCNSRNAVCERKEVTTLRTYWTQTCTAMSTGIMERDVECYQSITTQEFLFGEYWNKNDGTCPDIVSHINTAVHDISRSTPEIYRRNVRWFFEVVKYFLDVYCPTTIYVYSTAGRVNERHVPPQFKSLTTNEHVENFNRIATEIFNEMKHDRMKFGVDLHQVTTAFSDSDYLDAVHLQKYRYDEISRLFLTEMSLL